MAKRITEYQKQILEAVNKDLGKEILWLYEETKKARALYKNEDEIKSEFRIKNKEAEERGICHASDVVNMLGWSDNKLFRENRNRYIKITNLIGTSNGMGADEVHEIFMVTIKRFLLEDFKHPMDAMMSKKEQRNAKKRRKVEKKYGEKKGIKVSKTDEEKKKQSRLRKLKRSAKEENISLEDYMKKYEYGEDGKKIKK
jgi:hypothetical protein